MPGLYLHFPFCKSKCSYCSFYSTALLSLKDKYIKALCQEIRLQKSSWHAQSFETIYFGGGTPSLFTAGELSSIIEVLYKELNITSQVEFTMEANPEQLNSHYLSEISTLGINRLSIGIQSFNDHILKSLRRAHTAEQARVAIRHALNTGFDNISIDLIYGILERDSAEWRKEITTALSYPITHLSAYSLTVEENTLLAKRISKGECEMPPDEKAISDYLILQEEIKKGGFCQYEISNYARNGMISKHNYAYWQNKPYLGLGPSAHSYDLRARYWNIADINNYISSLEKGIIPFEKENLSQADLYNEHILLSLRTSAGLNVQSLLNRFGEEFYKTFLQNLKGIEKSKYIFENNHVRLSEEGKMFADSIAVELFYDE